ncbi:MAG: hypothetical protein Q9159_003117 [Coniocarpon cinnabarinum]
MSVRVVARIRPLLKSERESDTIVEPVASPASKVASTVRIPNPKNAAEQFSFNFNRVYDQEATQQELFENEVLPTVKHLFAGYDITLFAYGVTGTGKTHTMRGGKSIADRGVIPRLLSNIYRKGRKLEKDTGGEKRIDVAMSYYEIYNDKVFDLFEPIEKRTPAGLPIRDAGGKTVVSGLSERPCSTLKEFETLYDQANNNRSTAGTKLNAHSSRSHAILCVKVTQITPTHTVTSTASAIDLAGSEDNRRTDNNRERLVESSSINKSLFTLAQCVEAISKKQSRIPYRESKMTRILSLGQNNGLTIMILNLSPVRSFHLDTLSTLQVANRTKKIEVREVENEPVFGGPVKQSQHLSGVNISRQPLRSIPTAVNVGLPMAPAAREKPDKPAKAFSVYAEKGRSSRVSQPYSTLKRSSDTLNAPPRPSKALKTTINPNPKPAPCNKSIEEMINRLVDEKLASKVLFAPDKTQSTISDSVRARLDALESRVGSTEDAQSEGLQFLLMAKQHQAHGEDASALRMYRMALPFFPDNAKLADKMIALQAKLGHDQPVERERSRGRCRITRQSVDAENLEEDFERGNGDDEYHDIPSDDETDELALKKPRSRPSKRKAAHKDSMSGLALDSGSLTPRTQRLLHVINSRDIAQIRSLKGVGAKKAEAIVNALCEMGDEDLTVGGLEKLGRGVGVGSKGFEKMREGCAV